MIQYFQRCKFSNIHLFSYPIMRFVYISCSSSCEKSYTWHGSYDVPADTHTYKRGKLFLNRTPFFLSLSLSLSLFSFLSSSCRTLSPKKSKTSSLPKLLLVTISSANVDFLFIDLVCISQGHIVFSLFKVQSWCCIVDRGWYHISR